MFCKIFSARLTKRYQSNVLTEFKIYFADQCHIGRGLKKNEFYNFRNYSEHFVADDETTTELVEG